jgi:hypothetical protein
VLSRFLFVSLLVVRSKGIDFTTMAMVAAWMDYIACTIDTLCTR